MKVTLDSQDLMFRMIGETYVREWYTSTFNESGEITPFTQWTKHELEVVVVPTKTLKDLKDALRDLIEDHHEGCDCWHHQALREKP